MTHDTATGLSATLQHMRSAWQANKPGYAQRRADLKALRAAVKAQLPQMVAAINTDFGQRSAAVVGHQHHQVAHGGAHTVQPLAAQEEPLAHLTIHPALHGGHQLHFFRPHAQQYGGAGAVAGAVYFYRERAHRHMCVGAARMCDLARQQVGLAHKGA